MSGAKLLGWFLLLGAGLAVLRAAAAALALALGLGLLAFAFRHPKPAAAVAVVALLLEAMDRQPLAISACVGCLCLVAILNRKGEPERD